MISIEYGGKSYILTNHNDERFCLHHFEEIVLNLENFITIIQGFIQIKNEMWFQFTKFHFFN